MWGFFVFLFPCSLGMKQRSNVISYVTVNDSPDSDSSLNSPYATDPLSSLRSTGSALEQSRGAADSSSSRTIIVPPLKTQLNDCIVATQASGRCAVPGCCAQEFLPRLRCCLIPDSLRLCIGSSAALVFTAAVLRVQVLLCFQFH